jgi:nitrate reductase gamma subunit
MFITGFVVGLLLGLTLALSVFMLFLLRLQEERVRRRSPSIDRYA